MDLSASLAHAGANMKSVGRFWTEENRFESLCDAELRKLSKQKVAE